MKLNNKGFALTSIIYMLIVLFLLLLLLVLSNLASRKVVLDKLKNDTLNKFNQGGVQSNYKSLYDILINYYYSSENNGIGGYVTPPGKEVSTTSEGLIKTNDDMGDSYYFRGNVNNNYVSFGDKLFRIIRINGDGTVRMILDSSIGESVFSSSVDDSKYSGFTYDRDSSEVSSDIKNYLNDWYNGTGVFSSNTNSLINYDRYIASTVYCNDTSSQPIVYEGPKYIYYNGDTENYISLINQSPSNIYYNAFGRINPIAGFERSANPQFSCPQSSNTYGGIYNVKVGLISADEVALAGGTYYSDGVTVSSYLVDSNDFLTMTPYKYLNYSSENVLACYVSLASYINGEVSSVEENCFFDYDLDGDGKVTAADASLSMSDPISNYSFVVSNGFLKEKLINEQSQVRPVISLTRDASVMRGNGTLENPYVIFTD